MVRAAEPGFRCWLEAIRQGMEQVVRQNEIECTWQAGGVLTMDSKLFQEAAGTWHVNAVPTMRTLGEVMRQPDKTLRIDADEGSDLDGITPGPYQTIQEVIGAIAVYLGGQCITVRRRMY